MSGKAAWKAALAEYKLNPAKRGRTPAPSQTVTVAQGELSGIPVSSFEGLENNDKPQIELLQAVIASQKLTIKHYQEDLAHSHGKLNILKSELKKKTSKLHAQRDYDTLKAACEGCMKESFVKGQKKVNEIKLHISLTF